MVCLAHLSFPVSIYPVNGFLSPQMCGSGRGQVPLVLDRRSATLTGDVCSAVGKHLLVLCEALSFILSFSPSPPQSIKAKGKV